MEGLFTKSIRDFLEGPRRHALLNRENFMSTEDFMNQTTVTTLGLSSNQTNENSVTKPIGEMETQSNSNHRVFH